MKFLFLESADGTSHFTQFAVDSKALTQAGNIKLNTFALWSEITSYARMIIHSLTLLAAPQKRNSSTHAPSAAAYNCACN